MSIPIVEIFSSIEGEGWRSGYLCTFIRIAGCNLRCSYCDTTYSFDVAHAKRMTIEEICEQVEQLGCKFVTITGGEPLLQGELNQLVRSLLQQHCHINIETNGALDITNIERFAFEPLFFTVDWKSPSSGANQEMFVPNLYNIQSCDVLKFVVGSHDDLNEMLRVLTAHRIEARAIYVSPVFGQIQLVEIVDFLKQHKLQQVRLQIQLHKIVWDPNERGV